MSMQTSTTNNSEPVPFTPPEAIPAHVETWRDFILWKLPMKKLDEEIAEPDGLKNKRYYRTRLDTPEGAERMRLFYQGVRLPEIRKRVTGSNQG